MRCGIGATEGSLSVDRKPSAAPRTELGSRVLSGLILAPICLAAELLGGLPFAALVTLVGVVGLWEWASITRLTPPWFQWLGSLLLASGLLAVAAGRAGVAAAVLVGPVAAALVGALRNTSLLWSLLGFFYVGLPCAALILLRQAAPFGWASILFILFVVWTTDIAAYFGGRRIGGPKLWPRVSPKKTWSGAISGLLAALVAGGFTAWLTRTGTSLSGMCLALPLSIAAQIGDLLESAFKRRFGVKDSGRIIPGHGGVLDRVDGLLAAAALAWLVAALGLGGTILALPSGQGTAGVAGP